jgi:hypothetical protein
MALQREDEATALQPRVEAMVPPQVGELGAMVPRPQGEEVADAAPISRVC